jgi:hypothetical protein
MTGGTDAEPEAGGDGDVRHVTVHTDDAIVLRPSGSTAPASGTWFGHGHREVADQRAGTDLLQVAVTTSLPADASAGETDAADAELVYLASDGERIDVERIATWLEHRGSPMAPYAEDLVRAGVAYDVDPRVVLGIAGIESTVGEAIPEGSHNAWGWNGDGPRGLKAWDSWPEAIDDYTERLGRLYDTENVDEDFAQTYCPPNWEKWLDTVQWVMNDI